MRNLYLNRGSVYVFGARFPAVVFGLAVAVLVCSVLAAVGARNAAPIAAWLVFVPSLVGGAGHFWRLVTWPFVEPRLLGLVFGILIILFFGRDLFYIWGKRRFVAVMLLIPAGAALVTTLVGTVWPAVWDTPYFGTPVWMDVLIISWATLNPSRQILLYFVLPVGGTVLIYLTVGLTILAALLDGPQFYVPHMVAMGLTFAYLHGASLRPRGGWLNRDSAAPKRPSHLRPVEKAEPPRWLH